MSIITERNVDIRVCFLPFILAIFPILQLMKMGRIHAASILFVGSAVWLFYKRKISLSMPTIAFLIWVLLGLFWVTDYPSWASYFYHLSYGMSFLFLISSLGNGGLRLFIKVLLVLNTALLSFGLLEIFTHIHLPLSSLYTMEYSDPLTIYFINSTPSTIFHNPNDYGFYLAMSSWWLFNAFENPRHKIWYYLLLIINLFFVTSRISLVAVLLLLVADILASKHKTTRYGLVAVLAVYLYCLVFPMQIDVLGKYRQIKIGRSANSIIYFMTPSVVTYDDEVLEELNIDYSSVTRSEQSRSTLKSIRKHYNLGVGLGQTARGESVHNVWMEILSDLGLVGVGLLLWALSGGMKNYFRTPMKTAAILLVISGGIACLAPSNAISRVGFWLFIAVFCIQSGNFFSRRESLEAPLRS